MSVRRIENKIQSIAAILLLIMSSMFLVYESIGLREIRNQAASIQIDSSDIKQKNRNQGDYASLFSNSDLTGWIPFVEGVEVGIASEILAKSSDTTGINMDSKFYGMYNLTVNISGIVYNFLDIPGLGHSSEVGKPVVPMMARFIEVPKDVNISLEILYEDPHEMDGFYLMTLAGNIVNSVQR